MHPSRSDELFLLITTAIVAFGAMRSVAVVILFTQVFLSSIFGGGIEQLLCFSQLTDHFEEHRLRDPDITILDFVVLHYANDDHGRSEPERHAQLPFGTHHSLPQIMLSGAPSQHCEIALETALFVGLVDASLPDALHVFGVFHPPKVIV